MEKKHRCQLINVFVLLVFVGPGVKTPSGPSGVEPARQGNGKYDLIIQ